MANNIAVIAHFDANNTIEKNFIDLISCVRNVFDKTILVTTSDIHQDKIFEGVEIIRRPNIGYDFYSYRAGIFRAIKDKGASRVAILNSSVVLLDVDRFTDALRRMLLLGESHDVVGATSSMQFGWHLQSYMILFGQRVLKANWFYEYITSINPLNSKMEMILKYEIGLSAELVRNHASVATLFSPTSRADVNWTHVSAGPIARQLGYVKMEVLRDNPHGIDLREIREFASEERLKQIDEMVDRARRHYRLGSDNLVTLEREGAPPLPRMTRVQWGQPARTGVSVAVVVHLYYIDVIEEIVKYIENIIVPLDIFVTTPFEGDITSIIDRLARTASSVSLYVTENRGRDIGPFIALYRSGALDGYDAILKIHSKKSTYSDKGDAWRDGLYRSVVGDSLTVLRTIELLRSGEVGIVGPHIYYLTNERYWGADRDAVRHLLTVMNLLEAGDEPELGFFAGSMFWFQPRALSALHTVDEAELRFEPESGMQDGTLAHAIERLFCPIARKAGYRTTSAMLRGAEIHNTHTIENRVPVL